MKELTVETYTIDELEKNVRERVIDEYRYINVEDDEVWASEVTDECKAELAALGFTEIEFMWDVSFSQGSGMCFTGRLEPKKEDAPIELQKVWNTVGWVASMRRCGPSNFYSHSNTMCIEWEAEYYGDTAEEEEKAVELVDKYGDKFMQGIEEEARNICDKYHKKLENTCMEMTDDDAVADTLRENEYIFLKDGRYISE